MQLSATDYGNFLANEPLPLSTSTIADKATQIVVDQFNYLRNNSVEPLSRFLDYMRYVYLHRFASQLRILIHDYELPQLCLHD
jgi:V-type H+-transporting ATPase subunit d